MKISVLCLAAGALVVAGAASAQEPTTATPPNTTVTAPAKQKKEKRVCRERMRSGSHLTNVTCKTPEQWAELQEDYDSEAEYGVPGNKVASGRAINHGAPIVSGGPQRGGATPN